MSKPPTFALTPSLVADHAGSRVICLAAEGLGRRFALYDERPGPALNLRAHRDGQRVEWRADGRARDEQRARRADLPSGAAHVIAPVEAAPALIMVRISGPLEQRAGYEGDCGGWLDGHDAVADRLCAAFTEGDVLLMVDSPGGAAAGLQQAVERAQAAKTEHGRRVTVYADEMIGSAAMWWACAIGDEIFVPMAGQVGSIGARGEHVDISGMLAQEGVRKTYFADPPDKIAFAPEFPLSPTGEMRGNRDVKIAADAFRAAVCASPVGMRSGLTPEFLIDLGADMLTGQAAVDAGLADGVESLPTVVAYALGLAENGGAKEIETEARATASTTTKETTMSLRANSGTPPGARAEEDKPKGDEEAGREIPTKCAACHVENTADAKFCKGCGESMATEAVEPPPDSDAPKSSERPDERATAARSLAHVTAPRKMSSTASTASILGATADTPLAIKTAAIEMRAERDWLKSTLAGITGQDETAAMIGAALNIPGKIEAGRKAAADLAKIQTATDETERWALAHRLAAVAPNLRTKVLADVHDDAGKRILDAGGKPQMRIRTRYATMDLGVFRGIVTDLEGDAPRKERNPFEASREGAKEASEQAAATAGIGGAPGVPVLVNGEPSPADLARARRHPIAIKGADGDPKRLDAFARTLVLTAAQHNVPIGGAA